MTVYLTERSLGVPGLRGVWVGLLHPLSLTLKDH